MNSKSLKLAFVCTLLISAASLAKPPNTPTLDGRPIEYDASELVGTNPQSPFTSFGPGNVITNLFVTWDATNLYIALQAAEVNNKLAVMIDVDPGNGTGASSTTNWSNILPTYLHYNDVGWSKSDDISASDFGLDYMIASEGFFNNVLRITYDGVEVPGTNNVESIFDSGNTGPLGTPVDMSVRSDGTPDSLKGFETRIPWSVLYNSRFGIVGAETVPIGATIRLFAVLHNNNDIDTNNAFSAFCSDGIIPNQTSVLSSYDTGKWITDDYIDVIIDADSDGEPDLDVGDVNAPYLTTVTGAQGKRQVYVTFNEEVDNATATDPLNWLIGNDNAGTINQLLPNALLISLTNDLPASGTYIKIQATGVNDLANNDKTTYIYLNPAVSGIETSITVRFLLATNSGFGAASSNPKANTFFVNGGAAPLNFGYPPATNSPLSPTNGGFHFRDVTFPPATPETIFYKYSGILTSTGTNTYEAIRLDNYADISRQLKLPTNGTTFLVVTDWLGTVSSPYRDPGTNTSYNAVYADPRRGDAGVRQRTTITFQLNLNNRDLTGVSRVMVMGTDPLRGFNYDNANFGDFPGALVTWSQAGIELNDSGLMGDVTAGDGIYSRQWGWTTNGEDVVVEPGFPNSLVGGDGSTSPYFGFGWVNGRSPRSFKYKYFVYREQGDQNFASPGSDIEYYIPAGQTNIVLDPYLWANDNLPAPPPSNSPTMIAVNTTNTQTIVVFEGTDIAHGVQVSTNLISGWQDFGARGSTTIVPTVWNASIQNATLAENYRAFSGPAKPYRGIWVTPNPLPATGGVLTVYYNQHSRPLAGQRGGLFLRGSFNGWNPTLPMTFVGDGIWKGEVSIPETELNPIQLKVYGQNNDTWEGYPSGPEGNVPVYRGSLRATWSPEMPTNGGLLSIVYDQTGGQLAAATNVNVHLGFTDFWNLGGQRTMTNIGGTLWEMTIEIPTNMHTSVNFVFTDGSSWDSESSGGRYWRAYIKDTVAEEE